MVAHGSCRRFGRKTVQEVQMDAVALGNSGTCSKLDSPGILTENVSHYPLQVYLTTPLTIAAVGIAFYAVRLNGETGFELDTHKVGFLSAVIVCERHGDLTISMQTVGFLVLLALVCQELLGLWMHLSGMKRSKHSQKTEGRWIRNYVHM